MGLIRKFKSMIGQQLRDADAGDDFTSFASNQAPNFAHQVYLEPKRISLIRSREFDQLRAILAKNATSNKLEMTDAQNHQQRVKKPNDPVSTIKKIDEIEDEMSKLWWKTIPMDFSNRQTS